ncbi:Exonuclease mut-7 [Dispira parvispora]|uniref:Exonuclease mut-7 n=1 Tax=Dispira parvispora TaxID=1520584 RepID=A0A9W8E2G4_9FUNG|nr:Exonuclease mut-7 [Dispira parvispora]
MNSTRETILTDIDTLAKGYRGRPTQGLVSEDDGIKRGKNYNEQKRVQTMNAVCDHIKTARERRSEEWTADQDGICNRINTMLHPLSRIPTQFQDDARRFVHAILVQNPLLLQTEMIITFGRFFSRKPKKLADNGVSFGEAREILKYPLVQALSQLDNPAQFILVTLQSFERGLDVCRYLSIFRKFMIKDTLQYQSALLLKACLQSIRNHPSRSAPRESLTPTALVTNNDPLVDPWSASPMFNDEHVPMLYIRELISRPTLSVYFTMDAFEFPKFWREKEANSIYVQPLVDLLMQQGHMMEVVQLMAKLNKLDLVPPVAILRGCIYHRRHDAFNAYLQLCPQETPRILDTINHLFYQFFTSLYLPLKVTPASDYVYPEALEKKQLIKVHTWRGVLSDMTQSLAKFYAGDRNLDHTHFYYIRLNQVFSQFLYLLRDFKTNKRAHRAVRLADGDPLLESLMLKASRFLFSAKKHKIHHQLLERELSRFKRAKRVKPRLPANKGRSPIRPLDLDNKVPAGNVHYYRLPNKVEVYWVDSLPALEKVREVAQKSRQVAVDCEWTNPTGGVSLDQWPALTHIGKSNPLKDELSLCQLAFDAGPTVFLVDVPGLLTQPETAAACSNLLQGILGNVNLLKVTYAFVNDWQVLRPTFGWPADMSTQVTPHCDMVTFPVPSVSFTSKERRSPEYAMYRQQKGLARLVRSTLGTYLDKEEQTSDWACRPLSKLQLCYAAIDVVCLLDVFKGFADRDHGAMKPFSQFKV